jgi:hypothetical protein
VCLLADAIDDLFADPHLARNAMWFPGGSGDPVPVRVILRRPDRVGGFGETRVAASAVEVEVRVAEASTLTAGDAFEVGGQRYVVEGTPLADGERLVWRAQARLA